MDKTTNTSGGVDENLTLELHPSTPELYVNSAEEAFSSQVEKYVVSKPVCVMRCLTPILNMNLGVFSSMSLVLSNPDHAVEIRTQLQQGTDEVDVSPSDGWTCPSSRSQTTISRYAAYQINSFSEVQQELRDPGGHQAADVVASEMETVVDDGAVTGGKPDIGTPNRRQKMLKFGTNVDLSDEKRWKHQLDELNKLPLFVRVMSTGNMLSYVGHTILGVNSVQLYMKVPGSRTPGHQENSNFCSVNVNIGPGDCEWFSVSIEYWSVICDMCTARNINYLTGSWWPSAKDLSDSRVPLYHFIQRPGDVVWIGPGTVHWVQALGWCNNVAWNVGPMNWFQYKVAIERHDFYKLHQFRSIVPMIQLSWNIAQCCTAAVCADRWLTTLLRSFLGDSLTACSIALSCAQKFGKDIKWHERVPGELAHYCEDCEAEVFNILFTVNDSGKYYVHCMSCALKLSPTLSNVLVLQQYNMSQLISIYNQLPS